MNVTFGRKLPDFVLELPLDGDFRFTLRARQTLTEPVDWPDDSEIEFRFHRTADPRNDLDPIIWPATIDGPNATWNVPEIDVAEVLTEDALHVRLRYREPPSAPSIPPSWTWMRGTVHAS